MPGPTSKAFSDLAVVRFQITSGKTRKGRTLKPEEIAALEEKRDRIVAEMVAERQQKFIGRITNHATLEADRVIREVHQAVQQCMAEELDKRLGPAPASAMEEALADRARANNRIRELRKESKNNPVCPGATQPTAPVASAGHEQSAEAQPAKRRRNEPGTDGVQLTPDTLPQMLPDIVDAAGQLKLTRCMSLIEPLLALAMLRGKKHHEMRTKKWQPGPYFLHVGKGETPPEFTSKLAETWPDAPRSELLPRGAIYGIIWYGAPLPSTELADDPWHGCGKWGMPALRGVEFAKPVTGVAGSMGTWYLKDEAIKAKVLAPLGTGTLRTFRP